MTSVSPLPLPLRHAFRIAHGTNTERTNALVAIGDGLGEAALPPYYPTRLDDVEAYVSSMRPLLEDIQIEAHPPLVSFLASIPQGPSPAKAAIDMALHDMLGKRLGVPVYVMYGLDPAAMPVSSYALPIPESRSELESMLSDVADFPFLKLKLGCGDETWDEDIVQITRSLYSGSLCVDVNAGWNIPTTITMMERLATANLLATHQ